MNKLRPLPYALDLNPQDIVAPPARRRLQRRAPAPLALEQRVMFDGATVDAVVRAADAAAAPAAAFADPARAGEGERAPAPAALAPASVLRGVQAEARREVVFIEDNLPDFMLLAESARAGADVVVLDHTRDGLQQMIAALQGREVDAIHLVTHGANGQVDLGSTRLSAANVDAMAGQLAQLGQSLSADGDLLLYGCDVAAGGSGDFLAGLARHTGADVAASIDTTGSSGFGNWTLEVQSGSIESAARAFDDAGWQGELVTTVFDAQQRQLVFAGAVKYDPSTNDTGIDNGDKMRFANVITIGGQAIDAIVTTTTDRITVGTYDSPNQPGTAAEAVDFFQPLTTVNSAGGSVTFKFDFVLSGTSTAVTLQNFVVNSYDIDSSGSSKVDRQFQEFKGFARYELSQATQLTANARPDGSVIFQYNAATSVNYTANLYADPYRVQVYYDSASSIQVRSGANGYNNGTFTDAAAHFSLEFKVRAWGGATNIIGSPAANLVYSDTRFDEAAANDGSIAASSTITLNNGVFSGTNGQAIAGVTFANLSAGLGATVVRTGDTTAVLSFTGAASAHAHANDVANFGVAFGNAAFANGNASAVTGATRADLVLDFDDPDLTAPAVNTGQSFSYAENRAANAVVGTVTATDAVGVTGFRFGDTHTNLSADGLFTIDAGGAIRITATGAASAGNDFDILPNAFTYAVQARDAANNWSVARDVTLNVTNLDDTAPAFTSGAGATVDENQNRLYTAQASDGVDYTNRVVSYALAAGGDAGLLQIDSATGVVRLASGNLDAETKAGYSFTVVARDVSGNAREQAVTVGVANIDEVAPAFASGALATVNENQSLLYTAQANDYVDFTNQVVSYTLVPGGDAGLLQIDSATGAVRLASGNLDVETKAGYNFTVRATDASGNARLQAVTVGVANIDEVAPAFASGALATVNENQNLLYTAQANDIVDFTNQVVSYALVPGGDAGLLQIDSTTGAVRLASGNLDFESKAGYSFTVRATDASGNAREQAVTVAVANIDEVAPAFALGAAANANENQNLLYTAQANDSVDATDGVVSYALAAGGDAGVLQIDSATGAVRLASGNLDAETKAGYSFTVRATDASGNARLEAVTVGVANIDEVAPAFSSGAVAIANENQNLLYTAQANDGVDYTNGVVSYALAAGGDAGVLQIDSATGAVRLASGNLDAETKAGYSFTVRATDASGNAREQAVTVTVANIDEVAPAFISGALATANENQNLLYTAQANDNVDYTNRVVSYALVPGGDAGLLQIDSATGAVRLASGNLDFEAMAGYNFTVRAVDASGNAREQAVTVGVVNLDDAAPVFGSGISATVSENQNLLYTAQANDSIDATDGVVSYALQAGGDANLLQIDSATGAVRLAAGSLDVDTKAGYSFTVVARDAAGNAREQAVTVAVANIDEVAPAFTSGATASANENQSLLYTAQANDIVDFTNQFVSYALVPGGDAGLLQIDSATGAVRLASGNLDFESKAGYSFTVRATDASGNAREQAVTVGVVNLDDAAPVFSSAISATVNENQNLLYTAQANDGVDYTNGVVSYALAAGGDAGVLQIDSATGAVRLASGNLDAETKAGYSFTVRATDASGNAREQAVTVTVANIDEVAPAFISGALATANENQNLLYTAQANDNVDYTNQAVSYALAAGGDANLLQIDSATSAVHLLSGNLDFEAKARYDFVVAATDASGNTRLQAVAVGVADLNEAPVGAGDSVATGEDTPLAGQLPGHADPDGDRADYVGLTPPLHGSVAIDTNGSYLYTPAQDYFGADSFTYALEDGRGGANTYRVDIAVTPVNDAPVAGPDTIRTIEDIEVSGRLPLALDAEGDAVVYSLDTGPAKGILALASDGTYTYTPLPEANGSDSFVYRVSDGGAGTLHTVAITIDPFNDVPLAADATIGTGEDRAYAGQLPGAGDVDNDPVRYALAASPAHGQVTIAPDGRYVYTPAADFHGSDSFSYRVSDDQGGFSVYTVNVTVNADNDAPAAADTGFATREDEAHGGSLPQAADIERDPVLYALAEQAEHGSVSVGADGRYTYSPAADYNGLDRFRYTVSDGRGGSATYTVEVTVTAVNDAPLASPAVRGAAVLGLPMAPVSVTPFTDIDSSAIAYGAMLAGGDELPAWLRFDPVALTFTGTPPAGALGTLDIVVRGSDGARDATATVTITVGNPAAPSQRASIDLMTRDTGRAQDDFVTTDGGAGRSVTGTLDAALGRNEVLQVSFDGGASWTLAAVDGAAWQALDNGAHAAGWTIVTRVTNTVAGLSGPELSRAVTLDRDAPGAPTVDSISTSSNTPVLTGAATLRQGETLGVNVNGQAYVVPVQDGRWTLDLATARPPVPLVAGRSYEVVATVTDAAGNSRSGNTAGVVSVSAPVVAQVQAAAPVVATPVPEAVVQAPTPVSEPAPVPVVRESVVPGSVVGGDSMLLGSGVGTRAAAVDFVDGLRGAALSDVYTRSEGFRTVVAKSDEPALVLFQGVPDQFVDVNARLSMSVPADAFAHTQPKAIVRLAAVLQDGRPLPTWVQFNGQTGQFTGEVPKGLTGELKIKLVARDLTGREAMALFRINVGQVQEGRTSGDAAGSGKAGLSERLGKAGQGKAATLRGRP